MHIANMKIWMYCLGKYTKYFVGPNSIIEFGSHNINGTIRNLFSGHIEYVGVDWRAGPNVDLVCLSHEVQLDKQFDVVVSSSMLEHDPHWEQSIQKMVDVLRDDGCMILSWGGATNPPHCHHHATDNQFHPLPAKKVLDLLSNLNIYVHEFRYEGLLEGVNTQDCVSADGMGEVFLVAFKDRKFAIGPSVMDVLIPEDALAVSIEQNNSVKLPKDKKYMTEHREELAKLRQFFPKPSKPS